MSSLLRDNLPLLREWHPTKNTFPPADLTSGSGKKVWWLGSCGHEWEARIAHRSSGSGCPVCKSHKVVPGINDLFTTHPELIEEWHPTKNTLTPTAVTSGSSQKVWWLGSCGHEWFTNIAIRANGGKCPYCSGNKVLEGFNDLATTHPTLSQEWVVNKNSKSIAEVSAGSRYKAIWQCNKGHEWEAVVKNRVFGRGCPYCSGYKRFEGLNNLGTLFPDIAAQWDFSKNIAYDIRTIPVSSPEQVWWKCDKNHEWFSSVTNRTRFDSGCPICSQSSGFSKKEQDLYDYISALLGNTKVHSRFRNLFPFELDIYVPEKTIAIEFNGLYWHSEEKGKPKNYHYDKWFACKEKGIQLIQVWEDDWNRNPDLVKRMLAYKLKMSSSGKVFARSTVVKSLSQNETRSFLEENHIQGSTDGSIRAGLFENMPDGIEKLVAVMVLKSEPGSKGKHLNLLRFSTSKQVVGGFTKLLKYVQLTYTPDSIITFSDNCISNGGLYRENGFIKVKEINPDYMYIANNQRIHKFNYRLKRFREDPKLKFEENLSERELAILNNIPRIWDAGKSKWEIRF